MRRRWTWGAMIALMLTLGASSHAKADGMEDMFGDAKLKSTEVAIKITEQGVTLYHAMNRDPPPTLQALVDQNMLQELPVDGWGHPLLYAPPGEGDTPGRISSMGPDGKPGTDDDIVVELK